MIFYQKTYPSDTPPVDAQFPCTVLVNDGWNDFGYHTLWGFVVYRSKEEKILEGSIKILKRDPTRPTEALEVTELPRPLIQLGDDYCSLCQSIECYERLRAAGPDIYQPFFLALRDAATFPKIAAEFQDMEGFQKSLLRFSEAEKAFREAGALFDGEKAKPSFIFGFECYVPGALESHKVDFDFSEHPTGLHRIAVIIGKNGTGKTQFLAQFAHAMSGLTESSTTAPKFSPNRPSFNRVIAVSYSVFDNFKRPLDDEGDNRTFSYKYCGIRSPNQSEGGTGAQFLSAEELRTRLVQASQLIGTDNRETTWRDILSILLEESVPESELTLSDLAFYERLSSGQRILVATVTEIIAHISPQSVILFDEPELHLHPEILAALARAIDRLLGEFDSYAIIATHSALLLQETLARQVRLFRRAGNIPRVDPLTIESFGENLTTITREVFAVDGDRHNFRTILERLLTGRSQEEVEAMFQLGLPLQAQAYLQALEREDRR